MLIDRDTFLPFDADLPEQNKGKVACIGSGPASLACAAGLRLKGYDVSIFEALPKAGGSLTYLVPEYKLPQQSVDEQIELLKQSGIKIFVNTPFCTSFNAKKLEKMGFQSVFLGMGLWGEKKINIAGADLKGVYNSSAFLALTKFKALNIHAEDRVVVCGSNQDAVFCSIVCALSNAKEVFLVSKKPLKDFSAQQEDIYFAHSLGISFLYGFEAKKFSGKDGIVKTFRAKTPDNLSCIELNASKIICAFSRFFSKPNAGCSLMLSKNKLIETQNFHTAKKGYFCAGSATSGERISLAESINDGKKAAEQIDLYMKKM